MKRIYLASPSLNLQLFLLGFITFFRHLINSAFFPPSSSHSNVVLLPSNCQALRRNRTQEQGRFKAKMFILIIITDSTAAEQARQVEAKISRGINNYGQNKLQMNMLCRRVAHCRLHGTVAVGTTTRLARYVAHEMKQHSGTRRGRRRLFDT